MAAASKTDSARHRLHKPLLLTLAVLVTLWFAFFDSHSLVKRLQWHHEYARLAKENAALKQQIETLEDRLAEPLSDEVIEKIAREQYGMRRVGETVYRVEPEP